MAALTIGGQAREIRYSSADLNQAERDILKAGGRVIGAVIGLHSGQFAQFEIEILLAAAWRHTMSTTRPALLLAQFYAEGGTLYDVQSEVIEAIIDSGVYGHRKNIDVEVETPANPPVARASA